MRKLAISAILIAVVLSLKSASAQDPTEVCKPEEIAERYIDLLSQAQSIEKLQEINLQLSSEITQCSGLTFSGSGDDVFGPVDIPPGQYILKFTGQDNDTASTEVLHGICPTVYAYIEYQGTTDSTEEIFTSEGCLFLTEIDAKSSWVLEFQPVQIYEVITPVNAEIALDALYRGDIQTFNSFNCRQSRISDEQFQALEIPEDVIVNSLKCDLVNYLMVCEARLTIDNGERVVCLFP